MKVAEIVDVAFLTVNRWKAEQARFHIKAMKNIKDYCENNNLLHKDVEEACKLYSWRK